MKQYSTIQNKPAIAVPKGTQLLLGIVFEHGAVISENDIASMILGREQVIDTNGEYESIDDYGFFVSNAGTPHSTFALGSSGKEPQLFNIPCKSPDFEHMLSLAYRLHWRDSEILKGLDQILTAYVQKERPSLFVDIRIAQFRRLCVDMKTRVWILPWIAEPEEIISLRQSGGYHILVAKNDTHESVCQKIQRLIIELGSAEDEIVE